LPANEKFFTALEEATKGRFKVKYNYGIIPKRPDVVPSVGTGVCEVSGSLPIYHPAELPLATITELWGWHTGDLDINAQLLKYVFTHPLVAANLAEMNVVYAASGSADPFKIVVGKGVKKIETAEDLKGLHFGATGYRTLWAEKLGMVPVSTTVLDMYEFLEKGMVDMIGANIGMTAGFRFYEVIDFAIELALGGPTGFEVANKDAWDKLPQYIKDLWWELHPEHYTAYSMEITGAQAKQLEGIYKEKGIESYRLPPAEEAKLEAALKPMWEAWAADKAKYPGGEKIAEFVKDCIAYRDKITGKPFTIYTP
jgi:TRAP-type mannitol/chloroaromatic compound transport system substrate-binding protein